MTAHESCNPERCCRCGRDISSMQERVVSLTILVYSHMRLEPGVGYICGHCAFGFLEYAHPQLMEEPQYVSSKDQCLACMKETDDEPL